MWVYTLVVKVCNKYSHPLIRIVRSTTTMMVRTLTIGGIMNIADLPCLVGTTTNKSSLFSKNNVTAKPCSLHVHYSWPSRQRTHRERTLCVWSWSGGGTTGWGVDCVIEYMRDARKDVHWDCNGQWLLGRSIPVGILMVKVLDGGGSTGLPLSCNKRCHASTANLYVYICWLSMNLWSLEQLA